MIYYLNLDFDEAFNVNEKPFCMIKQRFTSQQIKKQNDVKRIT